MVHPFFDIALLKFIPIRHALINFHLFLSLLDQLTTIFIPILFFPSIATMFNKNLLAFGFIVKQHSISNTLNH